MNVLPKLALIGLGVFLSLALPLMAGAALSPPMGGGGAAAFVGGVLTTALTFSGITTDITSGTNEDITIDANGTGALNLNDLVFIRNAGSSGKVMSVGASGNEFLAVYATRTNAPLVQLTTTPLGLAVSTSALAACASGYEGNVIHRYKAGTGSGNCVCGRNAAGTYAWVADHVQGTFVDGDC